MLDIDTIFFDVDGTLVDATRDITNAMNRALAEMGLPQKPHEEIVSYIGTGVRYLVSSSIGRDEEALVDRGVRLYSEYYVRHPADHTVIYPNVVNTLEYFSRKRKYILTNRYSRFADAMLRAIGLRHFFLGIIGGDDENCLKPSACVFDRPDNKIEFEKEKTMIVGDMAVDVETGKNAGIKTCWVSYGLGDPDEIARLKPDYSLDDIGELKKIIKL
ncbi:MAG TPA: HAD-IA family hydrolase [Candidatus Omnitrophota bacterium]|nr:HAD-IA family hydrolase [Candidatus Omnitrophota bacterium]